MITMLMLDSAPFSAFITRSHNSHIAIALPNFLSRTVRVRPRRKVRAILHSIVYESRSHQCIIIILYVKLCECQSYLAMVIPKLWCVQDVCMRFCASALEWLCVAVYSYGMFMSQLRLENCVQLRLENCVRSDRFRMLWSLSDMLFPYSQKVCSCFTDGLE